MERVMSRFQRTGRQAGNEQACVKKDRFEHYITPSQKPAPGPLQFDLPWQVFGLVPCGQGLTVAGTAPALHRISLFHDLDANIVNYDER